ncbi:hypothetical protein HRI_001781400 [Hibiscus trionum]|nr:hypothetical protein HRI_001780800 [Hibiscus trionum]GMI81117.1 hypothetical protein HRI_001781000 [Hibiscus trionum]GMI81119.1 hypothetical protein HRI_001781200 [Hibiscus trionum]GMI81121.1 hypothetical protein HRI_001781400 [Hibiscus trionum]
MDTKCGEKPRRRRERMGWNFESYGTATENTRLGHVCPWILGGCSSAIFHTRSSRPRKKTADGLTIYTEEELGNLMLGNGNTPLCPFDCD